MNLPATELHDLIRAMVKLDVKSQQWQNVVAFVRSCYACRVMSFDLDAATEALNRLTEREEHVLIASILRHEARDAA
jgi:hypothetical protein